MIEELDPTSERLQISEENIKLVLRTLKFFMEIAIKTNPCLFKSVVTGIQRISGETLYSGINNFKFNTMLSSSLNKHYGVTEGEMDFLIKQYLGDFENL